MRWKRVRLIGLDRFRLNFAGQSHRQPLSGNSTTLTEAGQILLRSKLALEEAPREISGCGGAHIQEHIGLLHLNSGTES